MRFTYTAWNSVAIGISLLLATVAGRPLLDHAPHWGFVVTMAAISAVCGASGALLKVPRIVTILVTMFVLTGFLIWVGVRWSPVDGGIWPQLMALGREGIAAIQSSNAPLPYNGGLMWLVLIALALVAVLLELLVNGLEQPAWSIAPLTVLFSIGAIAMPDEMGALEFLALVAGYGLILVTATGFHNHRAANTTERAGYGASRVLVSLLVLALAAGLTLAASPAVPMGDKRPWLATEPGKPIELSDPTIALSENLTRDDEFEVLRYTSADGQAEYLRTVALTQLTTDGAVLSPMQLATSGLKRAYDFPGKDVEVEVQMQQPSEYLPAPFAVDRFSADGQWAFDPDTMSVIATGDNRVEQTNGLSYKVRSVAPNPSREVLESRAAGTLDDEGASLQVPEGLDPGVEELVDAVTAQASTPGAKAIEIQRFLRSAEFDYSLEAPSNTSLDTISSFLLDSQSGYCIHFATAMVTMSRIEGIPARLAIGFTPGQQEGEQFVVTNHNMHAWPELYFEDLGWVPFEPTPSVASPPNWTAPDENADTEVSPSPVPSPESPEPSEPPSSPEDPSSAPEEPSPTASPSSSEEPTPDPEPGTDWAAVIRAVATVLGIVAVVAAVALAPAGIRWGQRRWRLRAGQPGTEAAENAWREIRASMLDARLEWSQRSPVLASREVGEQLSEDAAETLAAVARTVERSRYARDEADVSALAEQVRAVRKALDEQLGNRRHLARYVPASLIR